MSTDQTQTPDSALSSPVPAPETAPPAAGTPATNTQAGADVPSPAPVSPPVAASPAAPTLAVGDVATYVQTDSDGFETELTCLVTEVFVHPVATLNSEGQVTGYVDSEHARVIVLPPANVIEAARLARLG